jgi:hypothetical protein
MSRSIDEAIEPEEEKPQIENSEIFDISMGIFFSLEELHRKSDAIIKHLGIEMPTNTGETPEN